jgi:hypothetical protein
VKEAEQLIALGAQVRLDGGALLQKMEVANRLITSYVAVLIVLAVLKLGLAILVTRYFIQTPETTSSLINESASAPAGRISSNWKKAQIAQIGALLTFLVGAFLCLNPVPLVSVVKVLCLLALLLLLISGLLNMTSIWRRYLRPVFDLLRGADASDGAARDVNEDAGAVAVESYDVFLSYSSQDAKEAEALGKVIEIAGGNVFFAGSNLRPGDDFEERIRDAIPSCREFWLLASPDSLKSEWVRRECAAAWALKKKIVPILRNCLPGELPNNISRIHTVEFDHHLDYIKERFPR